MNLKKSFKSLTVFELVLWLVSCAGVLLSSLIGDFSVLSLAAPIIGVTALIFIAKGDVLGQLLTLIFSVLYAVVSFRLRYYGEMITYLGMTAPMAALSAVAWLKNPFERGKSEVRIARLSKTEKIAAPLLCRSCDVCILLYFKSTGQCKPCCQHRFRYDQLYGVVSYILPFLLLRAGVCRKRYSTYCPVVCGVLFRPFIFIDGHLLFDVFHKRRLRLY